MISRQEVEKLANLSRLSLTEEELGKFSAEIEAILGYVAKIDEVLLDDINISPKVVNSFREDEVIHKGGDYTERLLDASPEREGGYIKVKKILD